VVKIPIGSEIAVYLSIKIKPVLLFYSLTWLNLEFSKLRYRNCVKKYAK